jgi:hypothetical protein
MPYSVIKTKRSDPKHTEVVAEFPTEREALERLTVLMADDETDRYTFCIEPPYFQPGEKA